MTTLAYECDGCEARTTGYGWSELLDEGWKSWPAGKDRVFRLCGECVERYERRRELSEALGVRAKR